MKPRLSRRLVAAALVAGTHFSLCTGGLLSATAALASNFPPDAVDALMTKAVPEDFVCMSMSPVREDSDEGSPQKSGCENGAECLDQAHASITSSFSVTVSSVDGDATEPSTLSTPIVSPFSLKGIQIAWHGPPLFDARSHANILVKRE